MPHARPVTWLRIVGFAGVAAASTILPNTTYSDEDGASFWLPGQMGSFAATPGASNWIT